MGVEGFIMKRRRRSVQSFAQEEEASKDVDSKSYLDWKLVSLPDSQRTELLFAWDRLERVLGEKVNFQEDACVEAMHKFGVKPVRLWAEETLLQNPENSARDGDNGVISSNDINKMESNPKANSSKWNVSYWISTVLGSALGNPYACHILEKQLNYDNVEQIPTYSKDNNTMLPPTIRKANDTPVVSYLPTNASLS